MFYRYYRCAESTISNVSLSTADNSFRDKQTFTTVLSSIVLAVLATGSFVAAAKGSQQPNLCAIQLTATKQALC